MSEKGEIERLALRKFSFLIAKYGFEGPRTERLSWTTRIDYLAKDVGIEVELDWKELDMFILLVRLEDGRLPDGYYVSSSGVTRIHVENALLIEKSARTKYGEILAGRQKLRKPSIQRIRSRLDFYETLLKSNIDFLLAHQRELFKTNIIPET